MASLASCAASGLHAGRGVSRHVAVCRGLARGSTQLRIARVAKKGAAASRAAVRRAAVAVRAQATARTAQGTIPVSIVVPECRLAFGEGMKLVGGCPQMGGWSLAAGAQLTWQEGDNWSVLLDLPAGTHEFKLVITKAEGEPFWEEGDNRRINVALQPASTPVSATCRFGDTSATAIAGESEVAPAALQVSSGAARAGSGAGSSNNGRFGGGAGGGGGLSGGASKAAQLAAQAVKAAAEQQPAESAAEAEQLQAAVDAAAKRVAALDRRKDELAVKLETLTQDMEQKLDIRLDRSPSPAPRRAAPAAAAKQAAAQQPKPIAARSPSGSPATSRPGTPAFAAPEEIVAPTATTGVVTLFLLPLLVPMLLAIYVSLQSGFPELHLPPLNLKEYQGMANKALKSVSSSTAGLGKQLESLQTAAQKTVSQLGDASKGAVEKAGAAADAAKQNQLPGGK